MDDDEKKAEGASFFPPLGRRDFLQTTLSTAIVTTIVANSSDVLAKIAGDDSAPAGDTETVRLSINGENREFHIDARTTLLDALRDHVQLTGTKKGCDRGQCGACTVLVNNRRINSCMTLALMHEGDDIVTIEGLARGDNLHPLQQAFIERDALQCGYCTPGQICSGVAAIAELRKGDPSYVTATRDRNAIIDAKAIEISDAEIRERMSGNICRCGAYTNIVAAIKDVLHDNHGATAAGDSHAAV